MIHGIIILDEICDPKYRYCHFKCQKCETWYCFLAARYASPSIVILAARNVIHGIVI